MMIQEVSSSSTASWRKENNANSSKRHRKSSILSADNQKFVWQQPRFSTSSRTTLWSRVSSWVGYEPLVIVTRRKKSPWEKAREIPSHFVKHILLPVRKVLVQWAQVIQKRRQFYVENPSSVFREVICHPLRSYLVLLVVIAAVETVFEDGLIRKRPNFKQILSKQWKIYRQQPGGLLRLRTWKDRKILQRAIREQIPRRYRFAVGAAMGVIVSPLTWYYAGVHNLLWFCGTFVVAEVHCWVKDQWKGYGTFMDTTEFPILWQFDECMEIIRGRTTMATTMQQHHKNTPPHAAVQHNLLSAVRDKIDPSFRFEEDLSTEIVRGLVWGLLVGTLVAI